LREVLGDFFMQREIDGHRAVRKMNAAVVGAIDHYGIEEGMYIAMVGTAINLNKGPAVAGAEKPPEISEDMGSVLYFILTCSY